jgi:SAM-dependent methyltransferase
MHRPRHGLAKSRFEHLVLYRAWAILKHLVIAGFFRAVVENPETGLREMDELISEFAAEPCLDVGGGEGHTAARSQSRSGGWVVLESGDAVCLALRRTYPRVVLVKGTATSLPFRDGAFATTIYRAVVHHLEDPAAALREAARVSRRTIILDHIADERRIVRFLEKYWLLLQDGGASLYDECFWRKLVDDSGGHFVRFIAGTRFRYFVSAVIDWSDRRAPEAS